MARALSASFVLALAWLPACAHAEEITVFGRVREYQAHFPAGVAQEKKLPLVFVLHGGGGSGRIARRYARMDALADAQGFAVVYPDALDGHWNDGRKPGEADDVAFLRAIVSKLAPRIDATRVYSAGISNGGMMSLRLACEASDVFAAVGVVAASMPALRAPLCKPEHPVSLILIHGTVDGYVPYDGGEVIGKRGLVIGVQRTLDLWRRLAACTGDAKVEHLDRIAGDDTRVRIETWSSCKQNSSISFARVDGGGHTWPGAPSYDLILGPTSREIDATRMIWDFFAAHARVQTRGSE